ncbi:MAG: hypothetical protein HDR56_05315 [Treponema sp.]|nr:hypothetical protein [Treponema sp.]
MKSYLPILKTVCISVVAFVFTGAGFLFWSCNSNVGLGSSVDTEAPKVSIEYPPSNAIVRGAFILAGECSDDRGVEKVEVTIANSGGSLVHTAKPEEDGTWKVEINDKGSNSSYPLADGKYVFRAVAYDEIGRESTIAERAIEIDNTEPVFIIKSPGGIDINNPTSYGSMFKVAGNIADDHDIKEFHVEVYEKETSNILLDCYEANISVAGGTEVTFAQYDRQATYNPSGESLNDRYLDMYGADTSGDKPFYCTVRIIDAAEQYTTPKNDTGGGWNTNPDADSEGNVTTKVYLYDDVYTKYMGKNSEYKFTASDFKAILNGSYKVTDADAATQGESRAAGITSEKAQELREELLKVLKDTATENERLAFKLNKDANPHYEFSGYAIDKDNNVYNFDANSASKGSKITFTAKMGLDETLIDPKNITVYCFGPYESVTDAEMSKIYSNPKAYYEAAAPDKKNQLFNGSEEYKGGTVESFTQTFTMGDISDGKKYVLAAYGVDQDDLELVESVEYGFAGIASGQPPRITITKPTSSNNAVIQLAGDMKIEGTATSVSSEITKIEYDITVYDEGNGNKEIGIIKGTTKPILTTGSNNANAAYTWNFDIKDGDGYSKCAAKKGDNYKYVIRVVATNSIGLEGQADTTLAVDAKEPEINNITVTPIAKNDTNPVVNGRIKVSFSIADSYLAGTKTRLVLKQGDKVVKEFKDKYKDSQTLIEEYIYTTTTEFEDNKDLTFEVTVEDKAENRTTKTYTCHINQSTDDPVVTITGAEDSTSVKKASEIEAGKNLFGVSSRTLSGSVSDDDGIDNAYISVYAGEGVAGKKPLEKHNKIKIEGTLSHQLPEEEGVYTVVVEATDKREKGDTTPGRSITKTYYVAVDAGAPTIKDMSPASGGFVSLENGMTVNGIVTDGNGIASIAVITGIDKDSNGNIEWDETNGTAGGTSTQFDKNGAKTEAKFVKGVKKYEIKDDIIKPVQDAQGTYAVKYIATDIYGQSSEHQITYNIDAGAPTFTITKINTEPVSLSGGSATAPNKKHLNKSSGFLDVEGTVTDDVAFDGSVFYKLATVAPNYNDLSDWGRSAIIPNGNSVKEGTWKLSIPMNNYDSGKTYSLYITFTDKANNVSKPDANPSGKVSVIPDGDKPTIGDFTSSTSSISSTNSNASITFTVTGLSDGENGSGIEKVLLFEDGNQAVSTPFTPSDNKYTEGTLTVDKDTYKNLYEQSREHKICARVFDKVGNYADTQPVTIGVDSKAPTVNITSVSPTVTKDDVPWLNGVVKVGVILIDETALSNNGCYWYVKDKDNNKIDGIIESVGADSNPISVPDAEKYYKNVELEINTTKITAGKGTYTLVIHAIDKGGNTEEAEKELNIDQSTDIPTLTINDVKENVAANEIKSGNNLFTPNKNLNGSASDDDGIKSIDWKLYNGEDATGTPQNGSGLPISLPNDEGYYTLVVTVTDTNNNDPIPPRSITKTYHIALDSGAPTFESVTPVNGNYYSQTNKMSVSGTVKDGNGIKNENGIAKIKRENKKNDGTIIDTAEVTVGSDGKFTNEVIPSATDGDYSVEYTATDIFEQSQKYIITYKVDSAAPTFTITKIDGNEVNLSGGSATAPDTVYLNKNNGALEVSGSVNDAVSGFDGFVYYALAENAPDYTAEKLNDTDVWKKTTITTLDNKDGTWEVSIPVKAEEYKSGKEYLLYITFKDGAGNISQPANNPSGKITVVPDGVAPTIEGLKADPNGLKNTNATADVKITATVKDDLSGIKSVELYENGDKISIEPTKSGDVYTFTITKTLYKDLYDVSGVHTLEVRATDNAGNETSNTVAVSVDTKAPTITINSISPRVAKGNDEYLNGTVTVSLNLTDETALGDGTAGTGNCYWYVTEKGKDEKIGGLSDHTDADGNNIIPISATEKLYKNLSISLDTTKISGDYNATTPEASKGEYVLHVYAVDKAGNDATATAELNIDQSTDIPEISLNKEDNDKLGIEGNTIQVTVKDDDEVGKVTYQLNGSELPETTFTRQDGQKKTDVSKTIELPADISTGKHELTVTVEDYVAGRAEPKKNKKTLTFIYDNDIPIISIDPLSEFQGKTFTITGSASDKSGIATVVGTLEGTVENVSVTAVVTPEEGSETDYTYRWSADVTIPNPVETATYKWTFTATDKNGRTNTAFVTHKVDETAPIFVDSSTVDADKITFKAGTLIVYSDRITVTNNSVWFKEGQNSITISGKLIETNPDHVIMTITGKDASGTDRSESVDYATASPNYSINSTYYDGTNTVVLQAYDKAGNSSDSRTFTLKVDTNAPSLDKDTVVITDENGKVLATDGTGTVNTKNLKLSYTATDLVKGSTSTEVSGLKQILIGAKYGFAADQALYDSDTASAFTVGSLTDEVTTDAPITIPLDNLSEGANTLYYRLIDVAGNVTEDELISFTYDITPATVSIVSPAADATVNKKIKITGSVSDTIALPDTVTGTLQIKEENGDWTDADTTTFSGSSWSCELDTTQYNATGTDKTFSIRMIIPDKAGNENDDEGRTITINQDSDRPKIVLTNMDITGTKIKQSTMVYGSLTDDDSDSTGVVKGLYIIKKSEFKDGEYPSGADTVRDGEPDNGWTKLAVQAGSGSFSYEGVGEGLFEFYFYCIDNEGTRFHRKADNALAQMKIAGINDKKNDGTYTYQDETGGISYTADMAAPVVTIRVARGDAPTDYSAGSKVFSKNGNYSQLYIELTAVEKVEMKKEKDENENEKFTTPTIKLNGNTLENLDRSNITINGTNIDSVLSTYKPTDGKYVYEIGPINLSAITDDTNGEPWTLSAEVSDASEQKGVGNMNITMDQNAPQILITSPSPSIGDAVMSAITVKGLAQDDASSIKDLGWVIPLKNPNDNYSVENRGLFTSIGNSTAWEIKFSSGSTDSPDSLLFYANATYNVEETVPGSGIYKVPIWFYVEDAVGNKAVRKTDGKTNEDGNPLVVYVDADGGKPKAWINSPEQEAKVTGLVTIYGGASDNISVDRVEIQVDVNGDGNYDKADYDLIVSGTLGDEIKNALKGSGDVELGKDSWCIPAIGTNSWKVTIDTTNITSDTKIGIRCRAWDNENTPLTRDWTAGEEVRVTIDSDAPAIRDVKLVQFGKGVNPMNTQNALPVSELEYTSGMYISDVSVENNGTWYLTATVTDNNKVASITTEPVNVSTSTHIVNLAPNVLTDYSAGTEKEQKIFIPIDTTQSGMVYSTLKATDDTNGLALKQILINIDSTAPSLFTTNNLLSSNANDNLRLKPSNSNNPIGDRNEQNREQVSNSNGLFTFGDYIQEAESGLAFLAFYFERSNTIYDPMNKGKDVTYAASATNNKVYKNAENLPALSLTVTRNAEDSLTMSGVSADNKTFIRKGGLVKIGGSYRLITKVDDDTVNFTPTCSTSFTNAEIIFAQIVDHQISEGVTADGEVDPTYDDGDGMIESVNHIGSSYIWSASINSSNIADGPITIGVAAIDNAGNIATGSVKTFVSNNRPRIAKVMLATDLNGDGKFTYAASENNYVPIHDVSSLKEEDRNSRLTYIKDNLVDGSSFGEFNYYKVMTPTGIAQEKAELTSGAFKVVEKLCVLPEFVGGNGDIKYIMTQSATKDTDDYKSIKTGSALTAMKAKNALSEVANHGNNPTGDQYNSIISEKGGIVIDTLDPDFVNGEDKTYLSFTFWDATAGTEQGTTSQWAHLQVPITYLTNETNVPAPTITPFYWNSKDDNSVHKDSDGKFQGHIELGALPQVSGKIVIEGIAKDDVRLSSVTVNVNGIVNGAELTYSGGAWTYAGGVAGVESFVGEDEEISQKGHTMKWKLVCDTEKLSTKAGPSYVNVSAKDWKNNELTASGTTVTKKPHDLSESTSIIQSTATGSEQTAYYKIDVVPYITGVWTKLSEFYRSAPSVYARTALGHYPVSAGETVTIYGYNLSGSMTANIEGTTLNIGSVSTDSRPAMTGTGYNVTIPTTAKSGELVLTVNNFAAINNSNTNDAKGSYDGTDVSNMYNRQPNGVNNNTLTDDVEFDVWEFKTAAEPKNGPILQPHMKIGPEGEIGFSYDNATLYFNMPGIASDGKKYGQTIFGRNFGGFTQNTFTYDKSGRAFGVALCPDTSGAAGMSANLQFFSARSGLHEKETGGDLNSNYYNQSNARRIENTSIKLDGNTIQQNINRILSPSMTTYTANNKTYVYTAYYDELSKQVRFRVGSVADNDDNDIGMGLVDLTGATGRVEGSEDAPKINPNTTRDSISGYSPINMERTISASSVTDDIYIKVTGNANDVRLWVWDFNGGSGDYFSGGYNNRPSMVKVSDGSWVYKLAGVTSCNFLFTGNRNFGNYKATTPGIYVFDMNSLGNYNDQDLTAVDGYKLSTGSIKYVEPASSMLSYAGHEYCYVVAANGVSGGTAEYSSATSKRAGQYVAVGALKDGTAVIAWYDSSAGRLAFSYNPSPRTAQTSLSDGTAVWQNNAYYVSNADIRAGTHVSMAVDASDGVHLAYYSASGGDLWYSYIENPKSQTSASAAVMVDSFGSVGTYTMIDVARDSTEGKFVPYISFRCESNAETSASVKIAYPVDGLENAGVGNADDYTGHWEISVVPTGNTPITDYTSIGVNKDWGTGVRRSFTTEPPQSKPWNATFAVGNSTTVYGNDTMHPIVSYAVSENYILEMAQKR